MLQLINRNRDWNEEKFYFRFVLSTDSSINYDGVSIDNIKLTEIPSQFKGNEYSYKSGTSMAAPVVSGIAGLIWSYNPNLSHLEVKNAILESVDTLSSLKGKVLTEGRVNAYKALLLSGAAQERKNKENNDCIREESGCFINSIFF